jgi:hypothetical protein
MLVAQEHHHLVEKTSLLMAAVGRISWRRTFKRRSVPQGTRIPPGTQVPWDLLAAAPGDIEEEATA